MAKNLTTGDRFFEVMRWWEEGIRQTKMGYLLMGKAIYYIKKERLWRADIEHIPTFKCWAEHSLHISVAQAHRLAQIYEELGDLLVDMPIDISKVTLLLPFMKGKSEEERKEMLEMAQDCTVEDIKNNIKDMTGKNESATDRCEHLESEIWNRCKKCGKFFK